MLNAESRLWALRAWIRTFTPGRVRINGYGFIEGFTCDGTTQPWSADVFGDNGIFKGGKALSVSFGVACGEFLCGEGFDEKIVQLKGKR